METKTIRSRLPRETIVRSIRKVVGLKIQNAEIQGMLAYHIFNIIHNSFYIKSYGGTDEFRGRWQPLSQKTIDRKLKTYPKNAYRINVASGQLYDSFEPNTYNQQGYVPSLNQQVSYTRKYLTIESKIPYSGHVHKRRSLTPENMGELATEALQRVLAEIIERELTA